MSFSGSYLKTDVEFLLKKIDIDFMSIAKKDELIRSNFIHYSEVLSPEYIPSKEYLDIFYSSFDLNKLKFAKDILTLSSNLANKNFVLVSLVRAGTPIGVLVKRTLSQRFNIDIPHYSISIIRDRGIDFNALLFIINNHPNKELIFLDGWVGKGVITKELKKYIKIFNNKYKKEISNLLYVVSDIAGLADYCVNNDDYLIPSSALNSTISGLVSRSVLNYKYMSKDDFHSCKYYSQYKDNDLSLWFVDEIMKIILVLDLKVKSLLRENKILFNKTQSFIEKLKKIYNIKDINYIKPGVGETTRVLLRREPFLILVKDLSDINLRHILLLAKEKFVKVEELPDLPYKALGIIRH